MDWPHSYVAKKVTGKLMGAFLDKDFQSDACFHMVNDTLSWLWCPDALPEKRTPSWCCGAESGRKTCCEWSTFVVNQIGMGSTETGLVVLVAAMFVVAFVVFLCVCAVFRLAFVNKWKRREKQDQLRLSTRIYEASLRKNSRSSYYQNYEPVSTKTTDV